MTLATLKRTLPKLPLTLSLTCILVFLDATALRAERLPTVVVENAERADMKQKLTLPGSLEPFEKAALYAKVTGYVEEIRVDIGDVVKKDEVLVKLTLPEMEMELVMAQVGLLVETARVHKAEADADFAAIDHKRLAGLHEAHPGTIAVQDVDIAAAQKQVADAQVEIAEAQLEMAKARIKRLQSLVSYATIRAPFDGVVTRRLADTGALIQAGATASDPIVEVVRTDKLRLVIDVPERVALYIRPGQKIKFSLDAFPGEFIEGAIARVAGALRPDTRNMRAEIHLENADGRLLPGMYGSVSLAFRDFTDGLRIPARALRSSENGSCVYAVEDGTLRKIPVTVLMDDGAQLIVTGRLEPGTALVVVGPLLLQENQRVQTQD